MNLPELQKLDIKGKRILLRADLDVGQNPQAGKDRLETLLPTLDYLVKGKAKVIIIGHRGRPAGKVVDELSLHPVARVLEGLLGQKIKFVYDLVGDKTQDEVAKIDEGKILLLENLKMMKCTEN